MLISLFLKVTTAAWATADSAPSPVKEKIAVRQPSKEKIKSYNEDRDFSYSRSLKPLDSFWGQVWRWVGYQVGRFVEKTSYNYFWKPMFYLIIIVTVIFVVMKLFGVEIRALFTKTTATVNIPFEILEENIHELNLDRLIAQATENRNYRLAVRYLYLKVLKQLSDQGHIEWKQGKTNRMYLFEVKKMELHGPFEYLTIQFEYIWYGEFEVTDNSYESVRSRFSEFGKGITL